MDVDKKTKAMIVRVTLRTNGYKSLTRTGNSWTVSLPAYFTKQTPKFAGLPWAKYHYEGTRIVLEPANESEVKELLKACEVDWEC